MQEKISSEKTTEKSINEQGASIVQLSTNVPGVLKVIKRDKETVLFDANKIRVAISKAFLDVENVNTTSSERIHDNVENLTAKVVNHFKKNIDREPIIDIENIQDRIELELMRNEFYSIARSYVLYREKRKIIRESAEIKTIKKINVKMPDGSSQQLNVNLLYASVKAACNNLENVDPKFVTESTISSLFDGVNLKDVDQAVIMECRSLIEQEPNYSFVTSRLLLDSLKKEVKSFLAIDTNKENIYPEYFHKYIKKGIELNILAPYLDKFDLDILANAIKPERDQKFTYLSIQTLYDRYLIHSNNTRYELPQAFFMRVAMGLAYEEDQPEKRAIEFYNILSSFSFMSSTPTLFNSGTLRPQLSSCFLTTIPDDLKGIYDSIRDNAMLSKYAGGIGNDWTPVRAIGSLIKGTNGKSLGVVPFMNVADATAVAVNQGGKRKGAVCAYLETWHLDIEEFLDLRKNTGDDRRRTHDMNTANWVPDLFMKRVINKEDWTLFSPEEVPDLHDKYGNNFEIAYTQYEEYAEAGKIKNFKKISAVALWRKMLSAIFETGHPWITFKDPCNIRSPQQHVGVVHSSNLCTEITLNTNDKEVAVCNLGSINLPMHIENKQLNRTKLEKTINTAIRMLDNVIDRNYYTIPQAEFSNMKHRPIGLGLMGFQDCLYELEINYESEEAVSFADLSMELTSYYAIKASNNLAKERGSYETFDGSLWSKGILPIDSINML
ncbi:MAG: ribonucleoside-diphosphate reductase subunit alpha, partial [Legionellales bacterium]|nr:ribonucleoside-diphosphate reductase subunit alpha [Legionellales bacterium]